MTCTTCGAAGQPGSMWCVRCGQALPPAFPPPANVRTPQHASGPAYAASTPMPSYAGAQFVSKPVYGPPPTWPADIGLVVPQNAVETGDLPRVCVVSGVPTDNMARQRWMWAPSWTYFFGLLVRYVVADRVTGYLPIARSVLRRHVALVLVCIAGFACGFVALVAGLMSTRPVVALVGLTFFVGSVVVLGIKGTLVKVKRAAPGYLAITNASPEFARAFKAGRAAGVAPYASKPPRFERPLVIVLAVGLGLFSAFGLLVNAVDPGWGCGCGTTPAAATLPPVLTRPGNAQCLSGGHPDVGPIEAAVDARNAEVLPLGTVPVTVADIATVRANDAALTASVNRWGMTEADRQAKQRYLMRLAEFDGVLGSSQAPAAAARLAAQESAMRQEFASVAAGCS